MTATGPDWFGLSGSAPSGGGGGADWFNLGTGTTANAAVPSGPSSAPRSPGVVATLRNFVFGAPKAAFAMAGQGAAELGHGVNLAEQNLTSLFHGDLAGTVARNVGPEGLGATRQQYGAEHPLTAGLTSSFGRTAGRAAGTVGALAQGKPSAIPYVKLAHEKGSPIVGAVLEDLANLSLLGEGASGLADASAADAAKAASERAAAAKTAGEAVGNAYEAHSSLLKDLAARPVGPVEGVNVARSAEAIAQAERDAATAAANAGSASARAEQLSRLADQVKTVSHLGSKAAASPFAPIDFAGRQLIGKVARPLLEHLAETGVGEKAAQFLANQETKAGVARQLQQMDFEQKRLAAPVAREEQFRTKLFGGNEDLNQAWQLHAEGIGPALGPAYAHADPALRAEMEHSLAGHAQVSEDAARTALQVAAGENEHLRGQFDVATERYAQNVAQPAAQRYESGYGEQPGKTPVGPDYARWNVEGTEPRLQPEAATRLESLRQQQLQVAGQAGEASRQLRGLGPAPTVDIAPRPGETPQQTAARATGEAQAAGEHGARLSAATESLRVNERALSRLNETYRAEYEQALNAVENAPARYRSALIVARQVQGSIEQYAQTLDKVAPEGGDAARAVGAEVLTTLKDAVDAGVNPPHMIGGEAQPGAPRGPRAELPRSRATGVRAAKMTATAARAGDERSRQFAQRVVEQVRNQFVNKIAATFGVAARDERVLGNDRVDEILRHEGAPFRGQELVDAAKARGLQVWDPASPFESPVKTARGITAENIDTVRLMPRSVLHEFGKYRTNTLSDHNLINAYDSLTRGTKTAWLSLSGRYHLGRVIGHTILAAVGGGVDPVTLFKHMADARRLLNMGPVADEAVLSRLSPKVRAGLDENAFAPAEVLNRGEISQQLRPPTEAVNPVRHPIGASRHFTATVDNIANLGLYMAKLDEGLTPRGYRDFLAQYPEFKGMPRAQVEREAAVRLTLRTLGDFSKMSVAERQVLSRAVFFYPWIRHITRLALNLAVHNPVRVAWLLHLSDMYGGGADTGVPWLNPAIPLGGNRYLRMPLNFNPFAHVAQLTGSSDTLDPSGLTGTINPLLSAGVALGTGIDLRTGQQLQRPPGSGKTDYAGRPTFTPLITKPREALSYLGGILPQVAAAREALPALVGHQPVLRYPTGEAMHSQLHDIPVDLTSPGGRTAARLVQLLGVPYEQTVDVPGILKRAQERRQVNAAQARAYARGGKPASSTTNAGPNWFNLGGTP